MIRHALNLLLLSTAITGQVTSPDGPYTPNSFDDGDVLAPNAVSPDFKPITNLKPSAVPKLRPAPSAKPAPSVAPFRNQTFYHNPRTFSSIITSIRVTSSSQSSSHSSSSTRKPSQRPSSTSHSSSIKPSSTPAPIVVSNGETVAAGLGAMIIGGALGGFVLAPSGALLPIAAGEAAVLSAAAGSGAGAAAREFELDPIDDKPDLPESVPEAKPTQQKPTEKPTENPATPTQDFFYCPEDFLYCPGDFLYCPGDFLYCLGDLFGCVIDILLLLDERILLPDLFSVFLLLHKRILLPDLFGVFLLPCDHLIQEEHYHYHTYVTASPGLEGQIQLRFNPELAVAGGCDPYPAVDALGNLGAGLKPTGHRRSGCGNGGTGQVYVRRGKTQGHVGVMFSYYFPKARWGGDNDEGQRDYWASIVVWVNRWGCMDDGDVSRVFPVGVSFTKDHLEWDAAPPGTISYVNSTHPQMQIRDNAMGYITGNNADDAFERKLVAWDELTPEAAYALSVVHYEHTQVPFIDANFQNSLDAAYEEGIFGSLTDEQGCDDAP
ncbi:NPP1 domain-containing protein [Colletotrichum orchidophilum]|uniref:NPP1 domain-containing protein n=1 Tax=Colletotrichum orchidophilum TaxID=1209926 RepID=A0A1G4BMF0_9PEZI|nr:NPP1 domain-containing protein [Colletotrichum orchidophilum]OHF02505.1 NPP1 domain-containing protein [Colletotrichum orchidophilum]